MPDVVDDRPAHRLGEARVEGAALAAGFHVAEVFESLELAGHFTGMDFDPALLFTAELERLRPAD
jgi:hypothetical protein